MLIIENRDIVDEPESRFQVPIKSQWSLLPDEHKKGGQQEEGLGVVRHVQHENIIKESLNDSEWSHWQPWVIHSP